MTNLTTARAKSREMLSAGESIDRVLVYLEVASIAAGQGSIRSILRRGRGLAEELFERGVPVDESGLIDDVKRLPGTRAPGGISIEAGLERTQTIRKALDVGRRRTVAFARVDVRGVSDEVVGVSGEAFRKSSLLGDGRVAGNTSRLGPGRLDAEVKILDDLRGRLDLNSSGTIDLFVDRAVCGNRAAAILEFRRLFPSIRLNVVAP